MQPGEAKPQGLRHSIARHAILLIRLRLIGDVVFTTPVIRALRRALPDAYLAYLVEQDAAAVVSGNPHLDEVIVISSGFSTICGWHHSSGSDGSIQ